MELKQQLMLIHHIGQMVKDSDAHKEEDIKKRELAETRNNLDSLIYTTEKSLSD